MTQVEVATAVGLTQRVVWRLMRNHGIEARPSVKRDQRGANNSTWKGDNATYAAFHHRVEAARGKPDKCNRCGTTDEAATFDWANLTGNYQDIWDYERMCRSCHFTYDKRGHRLNALLRQRKESARG